jgi:hypothetical protein
MARRYHALDYQAPPSLDSINKLLFKALRPRAVDILSATSFYEMLDLDPAEHLDRRALRPEEKAAIDQIAMALGLAAHSAHAPPPDVVKAWLEKIDRDPRLFFTAKYPPEACERIISHYRRAFEGSGEHLEDIVGRRKIKGLRKPKPATLLNIARSARRAAAAFSRKKGRPPNFTNHVLADRLARLFRSLGGRIARRQISAGEATGQKKIMQKGLFYCFVRQVIEPLNAHLASHGLPLASSMVIEKIAAKAAKNRKKIRPISSFRN